MSAPVAKIILPYLRAGSEIIISGDPNAREESAVVTTLADGRFVAAWNTEAGIGFGYKVVAQIYETDGTKSGPLLYSSGVAPNQNVNQFRPFVAPLTSGGFVLGWTYPYGRDGDRDSVHAQIYSATGARVGQEFQLNTQGAGSQNSVTLAGLRSGGFVATWVDGSGVGADTSGSGIKAQLFSPTGMKIGAEFLVNTTTIESQLLPSVAAMSNGGFVVTWQDRLIIGNSSIEVRGQIFNPIGEKVGVEFIVNSVTEGSQRRPVVTALPSGGFVAAWTDYSGQGGDNSLGSIKAQIFGTTGNKVGSEILVNTTTHGDQNFPAIATLPNGGFAVTWLDTGYGEYDLVRFQAFTSDGVKIGTELQVNTTPTARFEGLNSITASPSGHIFVSWTDGGDYNDSNNDQSFGIFGQLFAPGLRAIEQQTLELKGVFDVSDADGGSQFVVVRITAGTGQLVVDAGSSGVSVGILGPNAVVLTGSLAQIRALLGSGGPGAISYIANQDAPPDSTTLSLQIDAGGERSTATETLTITAVNDAPTALNTAVTLAEDERHVLSAADFRFTDPEGHALAGVMIDTLPVAGTLTLNGVAVQAGQAIGVADIAAGKLVFTPAPDANGAAYASLTFRVRDNGGTANGGIDTALQAAKLTFNVTAVDDAPSAVADTATTTESTAVRIAVLDQDTDIDGGPKLVAKIANVDVVSGQTVTLASGATVTLNADGTLGYNPNGRFDWLVSAQTALTNPALYTAQTTDSFAYTLNGGSTATVTVSIIGADGRGDQMRGGAGVIRIEGGTASDTINISMGGTLTVDAGAGNDGIYAGAVMTASHRLDGGTGTMDQLGLQGDYATGLAFASATIRNIDMIVLMAGNDTRFGASGTGSYSYNLRTHDDNVAAGQILAIQGNTLRTNENLTFDGSAETDGSFLIYAGYGTNKLAGGAGGDGFYFGQGRWNAANRVDGGSGGMDQIGLQGDFSGNNAIVFGANQIANVEMIVLLSGANTRFNGGGSRFSYTLTMHDNNVADSQTMTVQANALRVGEVLLLDASAERASTYIVYGGADGDVITGGSGADVIWGLGGADMLRGGAGNDVFAYNVVSDSVAGASDTILDFAHGDAIELSRLGLWDFIGSRDFTAPGQIRVVAGTDGQWIIEGNTVGTDGAELVISVVTGTGFTWQASDFRLTPAPASADLPLTIESLGLTL